MKRYRLVGNEFQEATDGAWVPYQDAQTDIFFLERWRRESEQSHERKDTEIAELKATINEGHRLYARSVAQLRDELTAACLERDELKRSLADRNAKS
jgi:hypothetical protein